MRGLSIAQTIFASLMVFFLIAPLIAILPLSLTSSMFLNYPIPEFSLRWFEELVTANVWKLSIINSLLIGVGTTILATILGTLAALGLRGSRTSLIFACLRTLFLLPMVVPAVVLGVGMQLMFVRYGLVNSHIGVIIAHTVVAVPFVLVNVAATLAGVDPTLERASASLGAPPVITLCKVTLPLALPGILSGAVFAFATSLDEVVLTLFVAGPGQRTLARQMFSSLRENLNPTIAAAAALFIIGTIILALMAALVRRLRSR